jgi:ABC-2 type transport system ATP-binding protein
MTKINAITINNLSYGYRSNWTLRKIKTLHNINLSVTVGEAFGFLGPNGSGKTTTIKCLLNLIKPLNGEIKIFAENSLNTKARAVVGYLPEQPYFYDQLTVQETLELYGTLAGIHKSQLAEAVNEALNTVGIEGRKNSNMRSLSKGLTQRVGLAQAIIAKPKLLILDEPFSGLDPIGRKEFFDIFVSFKKLGTTIFMSSHVLSDVEALCDRVSILVKGHLKGVFSIDEIRRSLSGSYELILRDAENHIEKLPTANEQIISNQFLRLKYHHEEDARMAMLYALNNNIKIEEYGVAHGGLEEFFVNLVKNG